jgi:BCD family chlorophyll transporter-like MFS transporter
VQATAAGLAIALGGAACNAIGSLALSGTLGPALAAPSTGYMFVYHFEILLLFAALVAIGPLVRVGAQRGGSNAGTRLGLAEMPG